jgi:lysyl-tRNA synthetase class 2
MGREELIIQERIKKLKELRAQGINPYPHKFDKKDSAFDLHAKYSKIKAEQRAGHKAKIAGRLVGYRDIGKIAFGVLYDDGSKIQLVLQEKHTPDKVLDFVKKFVDIGDFIGIEGEVYKTQRGELSILVHSLELLSKTTLPLPDKWHGIQDKEERYRKRYLDLLMNPEVRQIFEKREIILSTIRDFLKEKGFHEVDTPYLQTIYGGASAKPFKTNLNALDIDLYLAISPELYLKRLIVGGFNKVFTIARNFRNEGIDKWHNPEFTMMEIYQAYADYNDMMELFEDICIALAKKIHGSTKFKYKDVELDFKKPWKRMTMAEAIKKFAKIDVEKMSEKELAKIIKEHRIEAKGSSWGWYVQALFEHYCEKELIQPTFIIDHPLETTPLCKLHRSDKLCRIIERFEPFCMGAELGNAYSELNDPQLQRKLLEEQQKMLSKGNEEANPFDEDFVNALEIGMPPTGGLGMGIDRLIILLTGAESIRDVLLFPFMKPELQNEEKEAKANGRNNHKK